MWVGRSHPKEGIGDTQSCAHFVQSFRTSSLASADQSGSPHGWRIVDLHRPRSHITHVNDPCLRSIGVSVVLAVYPSLQFMRHPARTTGLPSIGIVTTTNQNDTSSPQPDRHKQGPIFKGPSTPPHGTVTGVNGASTLNAGLSQFS